MVHQIKRVVIAGAGVMGASMALLFAEYGYEVTVYDISGKALEAGRENMRNSLTGDVKEGKRGESEAREIFAKIRFTCEKKCFYAADFVVEAIVERLEIKHDFWREISELVSEKTVLTSNTSGLSLTQIAEAVKNPERFCGMHWLNPPHICPLVEVIKGKRTQDMTADIVYDVACDIGRYPVRLKKEVPGFLVNRFQFAILREAMSLVEEGVAGKEDIDKVFKYGLGLRYACLGPFEIADLGGLDTFYRIAEYLFPDLSNTAEVSEMLAELYTHGDYGVKTGKGFYDYSDGRDRKVIEKRDHDFKKIAKCLYEEP